MLDQQQDQHVEDSETTETQYLTNVFIQHSVSMLVSLMRHQFITQLLQMNILPTLAISEKK